mgnify:CR=1 FL=1
MGIKIKNKILDDFNKSYDCKLTAEDIIAKTDYFNTSPQTSQKVNPLFKVRYSYAFMYTLIIFLSLSVCGLFGYNQYIKKVDYCRQIVEVEPTLTDEDIEFINCYSTYSDVVELVRINVTKTDRIIIYIGIDKNDSSKTIFFYKTINIQNSNINYSLIVESNVIDINDSRIGILKSETCTSLKHNILSFSIETSSHPSLNGSFRYNS